jgi:hypothetical protein
MASHIHKELFSKKFDLVLDHHGDDQWHRSFCLGIVGMGVCTRLGNGSSITFSRYPHNNIADEIQEDQLIFK